MNHASLLTSKYCASSLHSSLFSSATMPVQRSIRARRTAVTSSNLTCRRVSPHKTTTMRKTTKVEQCKTLCTLGTEDSNISTRHGDPVPKLRRPGRLSGNSQSLTNYSILARADSGTQVCAFFALESRGHELIIDQAVERSTRVIEKAERGTNATRPLPPDGAGGVDNGLKHYQHVNRYLQFHG
jgi:hypothetical protein